MIYTTNVYNNNTITKAPATNDLLLHNHHNQHQHHLTATTTPTNKPWICNKNTSLMSSYFCIWSTVQQKPLSSTQVSEHDLAILWSAPTLRNQWRYLSTFTFNKRTYQVFISAAIHIKNTSTSHQQPQTSSSSSIFSCECSKSSDNNANMNNKNINLHLVTKLIQGRLNVFSIQLGRQLTMGTTKVGTTYPPPTILLGSFGSLNFQQLEKAYPHTTSHHSCP